MTDNLKWILLTTSNAPIQSVTEARIKAYWLSYFADQLQPADTGPSEIAEPSASMSQTEQP